MQCNKCGGTTRVIETRVTKKGAPWRRRKCEQCANKTYTVEIETEEMPVTVNSSKSIKATLTRNTLKVKSQEFVKVKSQELPKIKPKYNNVMARRSVEDAKNDKQYNEL